MTDEKPKEDEKKVDPLELTGVEKSKLAMLGIKKVRRITDLRDKNAEKNDKFLELAEKYKWLHWPPSMENGIMLPDKSIRGDCDAKQPLAPDEHRAVEQILRDSARIENDMGKIETEEYKYLCELAELHKVDFFPFCAKDGKFTPLDKTTEDQRPKQVLPFAFSSKR